MVSVRELLGLAVCQENIILCNIYEPVKDDECKIACEIKATYMYGNPEIPDLKYFNDKLVRIHVHNRMENYT